jgi:hypothetical protein
VPDHSAFIRPPSPSITILPVSFGVPLVTTH